ncbi:hypothetical protein, partial [Mycoplasma todarodis]|uniref:hypothetical protein n=1 Tax=Mycoplasma todarodis TaxID=1937191 RepID=UPI003B5065A3
LKMDFFVKIWHFLMFKKFKEKQPPALEIFVENFTIFLQKFWSKKQRKKIKKNWWIFKDFHSGI